MDSEAYWVQRAEEREKYWHNKCQETIEKELASYYRTSLGRIQTEIAALYGRFAVDNELTMAEARKLLKGNEFRQWRMDIQEYVKQIEATGDKGLERELNVLAMRSRISRLDKLYSETLIELDKLGRKVSKDMKAFLTDAYKDNYYHGLYDIAKAGELQNAVSKVDSKVLEDVLRTRWSGKNYSERIWKNQKLLAKTIKDEMMTAVHRGESVEKISTRVAKRMNVGISNARRLVRTELNFINNQASFESIEDAGMKYYRFIATLDRRTSAKCRSMDGKIFLLKNREYGVNIPPLHPNCRSTIAGSLYGPDKKKSGTRIARADNGNTYYVPVDMNYANWKTVYVEKSQSMADWLNGYKDAIIKLNSIPKTWQLINGPHNIEDDIIAVNPNYDKGDDYKINCQRCVQTLELRQRGYDITAMPKPAAGKDNPVLWGCECFSHPKAGEDASSAAVRMFTWRQTEASVKRELKNAPDGARYVIYVKWKGRATGAHVFIAQKEQGIVKYLDPQVGKNDVEWYFSQGSKGNFGFCRIDDKPIIDDEKILSATAKPR